MSSMMITICIHKYSNCT